MLIEYFSAQTIDNLPVELQFHAEIAIPLKMSSSIHLLGVMEPDSLPTEVILTHPRRSLGNIKLDWMPQPGNYLDLEGKTYAVLERRHRYQLKSGRYRLQNVSLYVQSAPRPTEKSFVDGRWVLGDASCNFNARSELIRCAVNPEGPCDRCQYYERKSENFPTPLPLLNEYH